MQVMNVHVLLIKAMCASGCTEAVRPIVDWWLLEKLVRKRFSVVGGTSWLSAVKFQLSSTPCSSCCMPSSSVGRCCLVSFLFEAPHHKAVARVEVVLGIIIVYTCGQ